MSSKLLSLLTLFIGVIILSSCNNTENIVGCTDPSASNYNPDALISDRCVYEFSKFIGDFDLMSACRTGLTTSELTYTVAIALTSNDEYDLMIYNLMDREETLQAVIGDGNTLIIPEQIVQSDTYRGHIDFEENGAIKGGIFGSPDTDCNFTGKKSD